MIGRPLPRIIDDDDGGDDDDDDDGDDDDMVVVMMMMMTMMMMVMMVVEVMGFQSSRKAEWSRDAEQLQKKGSKRWRER